MARESYTIHPLLFHRRRGGGGRGGKPLGPPLTRQRAVFPFPSPRHFLHHPISHLLVQRIPISPVIGRGWTSGTISCPRGVAGDEPGGGGEGG